MLAPFRDDRAKCSRWSHCNSALFTVSSKLQVTREPALYGFAWNRFMTRRSRVQVPAAEYARRIILPTGHPDMSATDDGAGHVTKAHKQRPAVADHNHTA